MAGYEDLMGSPTEVKDMSYPSIEYDGQHLPAIPTANALQLRARKAKKKMQTGDDYGSSGI